jgi:ATP-binding cassette subfamily C protein
MVIIHIRRPRGANDLNVFMTLLLKRPASADIADALRQCWSAFWSVAIFSGVVNVLMLTGPLYMLQVYDRVLASRSIPTLVALTVILIIAFAFQGAFDLLRSRIVIRASALFDRRISGIVHSAVIRLGNQTRNASEALQPVRDLDQIRQFLTGTGPIAIVDLPWTPIFLVVCFLIHPAIGILSLGSALLLLSLTVLTERASQTPARTVAQDAGLRSSMIESDRRNSETAIAMGMADILGRRWTSVNDRYVAAIGRSSDVVGSYGSLTKILRMLLQSFIRGLGAYFVIKQEMSAGAMVAASIMMGRALAPIETAIANWRSFLAARQSIERLSQTLAVKKPDYGTTELPAPTRSLEVEQVTVAAPGANSAIVTNINFALASGDVLGVIGPSGSGKTSLVRTLVGIWPAVRGTIRLDAAALNQWTPESRGKHIGYVSQGIELFDGTIAENISRMTLTADDNAIIQAAKAAGAHDMILRLPGGYDAKIGDAGSALSGGQRQRIALARALFNNPFLVVLDEPASNLDSEGDVALQQAIRRLKANGSIVILIAHRQSALSECDKVLFLSNGLQQAFGPRDEVLQRILSTRVAQPAATSSLKIVSEQKSGDGR